MYTMKRTLAVAMAAVMMVPASALAAPASPAPKVDLSKKTGTIEMEYTGKKEVLKVVIDGKELVENVDFTVVSPAVDTNVGNYTIKIKGQGNYTGETSITLNIKKASKPVVAINEKAQKAIAKGFKAKQLKKKSKTIKLGLKKKNVKSIKVKGKKAKKMISVNKRGKITLKKGIKKGTYKIVVKVKGTTNYNGGKKIIKIKVK